MDWVAGILELTGKWIVGQKDCRGWLVSMLSGVCWIMYVFISKSSYGLLIIAVPAIFVNLWNFHKWRDQ